MENNYSIRKYFEEICKTHKPKLSYLTNNLSFEDWHKKAKRKLITLCGKWPEKSELNPKITLVEEFESYSLNRVVFCSEKNMWVPCWLLLPKKEGKLPTILCSHGHGEFGKDPVAGVAPTEAHKQDIETMNYDYARQMAIRGFVTLVPDLRAFGERGDDVGFVDGHDACDAHYVKASILGMYPLTLNIFDMMRCIDFLETLPQVDKKRIGMMGLSQGGTMATFTAALDKRIKAVDIIGYVNPFAGFGMSEGNFCGSQVLPNLYTYFDTHDIAGLIAPRPLLMEIGKNDDCFAYKDLKYGCDKVCEIYKAAGADDNILIDIHDGGHAFAGNLAFEFFKKELN